VPVGTIESTFILLQMRENIELRSGRCKYNVDSIRDTSAHVKQTSGCYLCMNFCLKVAKDTLVVT
jgi:hypothetical protein